MGGVLYNWHSLQAVVHGENKKLTNNTLYLVCSALRALGGHGWIVMGSGKQDSILKYAQKTVASKEELGAEIRVC